MIIPSHVIGQMNNEIVRIINRDGRVPSVVMVDELNGRFVFTILP